MKPTTSNPGYINRNLQLNQGPTGLPGTDHNQEVHDLRCLRIIEAPGSFGLCAYEYGANGTDVFERKCPECQDGMPGLPLVATPAIVVL